MKKVVCDFITDVKTGKTCENIAEIELTYTFQNDTYSVDLCGTCGKVLTSNARKVAPPAGSVTRQRGKAAGLPMGAIRSWAQANGFEVSPRGRVKEEIVSAWRNATSADAPSD